MVSMSTPKTTIVSGWCIKNAPSIFLANDSAAFSDFILKVSDDEAKAKIVSVLADDEIVNTVNQVNDFSESLLREAATGKTLHKTVNEINPLNRDELPDKGGDQC